MIPGVVRNAFERVMMWSLRNHEMESLFLREYFRKNYDINIGGYSYGCFDRWRFPRHTTVGRYCSIAKSVRIVSANHPTAALSTHPYFYAKEFGVTAESRVKSSPCVIEDDVWLNHNCIITPGCSRIGRGSIVAAGAVVTKDVSPYSIVAGVPAKVVRWRFPANVIEAIEATRWWELDKETLKRIAINEPDALFNPAILERSHLLELFGAGSQ